MAVGWARDGAEQDQINATVADAVELARSRLTEGESLIHCEECESLIPEARRKAVSGVRLCVKCQSELENINHRSVISTAAVAKTASSNELIRFLAD